MIGILIVTHCDLGKEFLNAAEFIVGSVQGADYISITQTSDSEEIHKAIAEKIACLNTGEGVIILTDMFGGTPSNISLSFLKDEMVEVITGVNLPMVLAIAQNRGRCSMSSLANKAQEAAKMGISLAGNLLK
ncbi:MAG: PTS sugar transporter [Deltaproteobacteria bacterium]|nr:PTS sugar transporter [Deltaproteobacteria bacterium]